MRSILLWLVLLACVALTAAGLKERMHSIAPSSGMRVTSDVLNDAREKARSRQKFLMVEFGAGWCSDCLELSKKLNAGDRQTQLKRDFDLLYVDVGELNRNLDIARSLGIEPSEGIPAAAFFPPDGSTPVTTRGTYEILAFLDDRLSVRPFGAHKSPVSR